MSITNTLTGICPVCEETVPIRRDGTLRKHEQPYDPDGRIVGTITETGVEWHTRCAGSRRAPAIVLELTFARWLYAHRGRRDWRDNPTAQLARHMFGTRGSCGDCGPGQVGWTTAEGLHEELHRQQLRTTGSELRRPCSGQRCDWVCRLAEAAGVEFAAG